MSFSTASTAAAAAAAAATTTAASSGGSAGGGAVDQEAVARKAAAWQRLAKAVFDLQGKLIWDDVTPEALRSAGMVLCESQYDAVVEERMVEKRCGYPLCKNVVNQSARLIQMNAARRRIKDLQHTKGYCCEHCYNASMHYRAQLLDTPIHERVAAARPQIKLLDDDITVAPVAPSTSEAEAMRELERSLSDMSFKSPHMREVIETDDSDLVPPTAPVMVQANAVEGHVSTVQPKKPATPPVPPAPKPTTAEAAKPVEAATQSTSAGASKPAKKVLPPPRTPQVVIVHHSPIPGESSTMAALAAQAQRRVRFAETVTTHPIVSSEPATKPAVTAPAAAAPAPPSARSFMRDIVEEDDDDVSDGAPSLTSQYIPDAREISRIAAGERQVLPVPTASARDRVPVKAPTARTPDVDPTLGFMRERSVTTGAGAAGASAAGAAAAASKQKTTQLSVDKDPMFMSAKPQRNERIPSVAQAAPLVPKRSVVSSPHELPMDDLPPSHSVARKQPVAASANQSQESPQIQPQPQPTQQADDSGAYGFILGVKPGDVPVDNWHYYAGGEEDKDVADGDDVDNGDAGTYETKSRERRDVRYAAEQEDEEDGEDAERDDGGDKHESLFRRRQRLRQQQQQQQSPGSRRQNASQAEDEEDEDAYGSDEEEDEDDEEFDDDEDEDDDDEDDDDEAANEWSNWWWSRQSNAVANGPQQPAATPPTTADNAQPKHRTIAQWSMSRVQSEFGLSNFGVLLRLFSGWCSSECCQAMRRWARAVKRGSTVLEADDAKLLETRSAAVERLPEPPQFEQLISQIQTHAARISTLPAARTMLFRPNFLSRLTQFVWYLTVRGSLPQLTLQQWDAIALVVLLVMERISGEAQEWDSAAELVGLSQSELLHLIALFDLDSEQSDTEDTTLPPSTQRMRDLAKYRDVVRARIAAGDTSDLYSPEREDHKTAHSQ